MSQNKILFSIIIPTYNRSALLRKTVISFLEQTYPYFEIIVVDDAGTDDTETMLQHLGDSRIRYIRQIINQECGVARNKGASVAVGNYFNFFDSDDIAYPNHLSEAARAVEELNEPMVFHTGLEVKDAQNKIYYQRKRLNKPYANDEFLRHNHVNLNPVFIHRVAFGEVQFCADRRTAMPQDWLLHLRLAARFPFHVFDEQITCAIIQHDGRSLARTTASNYLQTINFMKGNLSQDAIFMKKYAKYLPQIEAQELTVSGLYFSLERAGKAAFRCTFRAFWLAPSWVTFRGILVVAKCLLLRKTNI